MMTEEEQKLLLHTLNEMMEGHFRIMNALNTLHDYLQNLDYNLR